MREYEFELLFKVNSSEEMNDLIDRLYEAGCDDALIGSGKSGVIGLSFTGTLTQRYKTRHGS